MPCRLESLTGVRDGDRMSAQLTLVTDSNRLTLDMVMQIGVPTRWVSGHYRWERGGSALEGAVSAEEEVTFLGGQSDGVSVGGVFLLLGPDNSPTHRVVLPTTKVTRTSRQR